MKTLMPTRALALALCGAALAAVSLTACNQQPAQSTAAVAAVPPPPTPPPVPQYNRTPDQEARWQHYMVMKQAYQDELARARNTGRQQQAAADAGGQASAFNAGRQDQAQVDQAHRDYDQATHQAQMQPDPHRRQQMMDQAKATLAAATHGR